MPDDFRCSDAAEGRAEPIFATGSQVRAWLLVEVGGAWGEDAIHDSALDEHVPARWKDELRARHIRVLCIRARARRGASDVQMFTCTARRPGEGIASLWHRRVDSLADAVRAAEDLEPGGAPGAGWERCTERLILVCTNGRHDQCCANRGRPLIRSLRESRWEERVWECSHVGGDRFAANVVVLPDSLYFGRVEPDVAPALLAGLDAGRIDLERFRGRTSLSFAEQAVEHFVRRELDIDAVDGVVVRGRSQDGTYAVEIGDRRLAVRIRQELVAVPEPLTCNGRPGQRAARFSLLSIT